MSTTTFDILSQQFFVFDDLTDATITSGAPGATDLAKVGKIWVDEDTDTAYILVDTTGGVATWATISPPPGGGVDSLGTDSGSATPVAGVINLLGGTGVSTSAVGNNITISAGSNPLDQIYLVAKNGSDATGDGSFANPFLTISKAMTEIGVPVDAADGKNRFTVLVMPGCYDEDVVMPAARIINLLGIGTVTLGDGAGSNFASTTPRNLTIDINDAVEVGGYRPSYTIATVLGSAGETSSTHAAYRTGFMISGNLVYNNIAVATTIEVSLDGVKVFGSVNGTSAGIGGINTLIYRSMFVGAYNSPTSLLNVVLSTQFDALITCSSYGRFTECELLTGMTYASANTNYPPNGFFNSKLAGTYTSTAHLYFDFVTYESFISNGASLVGGGLIKSKERVIKYTVADADATSGWTGPAGGFYSRTITAVTHGQGVYPSIEIYSYDGTKAILASVDTVEISSIGDITIKVSDSPDARFRARITIS